MYKNNKPMPRVKVLYVKELGPGKSNEIALLRTLPWVSEVIVADYRFKVGNEQQNAHFLHNLYHQWDEKSTISKRDICKYINLSLDDLVKLYLQLGVDCIFIAGSANDPSAQYCNEAPTRITPDIRREQFELKLISMAKHRGIPLLAVCAGSWRLTNAYGAKTYVVKEDVRLHENWDAARHPDNLTLLKPGSVLQQIHVAAQRNKDIKFIEGKALKTLERREQPNRNFLPQYLKVNTTHWRVSPQPETQHGTEFHRTFETAAIDLKHGTVESYEFKHGAPVLAVQFHPEYVIPHVQQKDGSSVIVEDYKTHRSILDFLVESGLTFSRKRQITSKALIQQRSRLRLINGIGSNARL